MVLWGLLLASWKHCTTTEPSAHDHVAGPSSWIGCPPARTPWSRGASPFGPSGRQPPAWTFPSSS
eukprot:15468542-Alexandrium_andersonii.AAC.1